MSGFSDLVGNGADCGPGNGMSGLMKQFNKDHSLEQASRKRVYVYANMADRFGPPAQASTSRQAFRQTFRQGTGHAMPANAMANEFMAQANKTQGPGSFNFAEMHREINGMQTKPGAPQADWSADFARHQMAGGPNAEFERAFAGAGAVSGAPGPMGQMLVRPMGAQHANWAEQFHRPAAQAAAVSHTQAQAPVVAQPMMRPDAMAMAFNEARMYSMMPGPSMMMNRPPMAYQQHQQQVGETAQQQQQEQKQQEQPELAKQGDDDLAKTAAQILDSVSGTANPKFKQSEFFSFMQQLADGQATISGDQVVSTDKGKQAEPVQQQDQAASGPTWATEFEQRAEDLINRESVTRTGEPTPKDATIFSPEFAGAMERNWAEEFEKTLDGPLQETGVSGHPQDIDFSAKEPSSEYVHREADKEWLERFKDNIQPLLNEHDREWLDTQKEWESLNTLEPVHRAVDPELSIYHFQKENPFASMGAEQLRESIEQMQRDPESASLGDAILALENAVAQEPQDASMWLKLGLKQQENEQEQAAIAALRKAVSLDPDALDAHLALAVSYTNEGYQMDAYDELHEWVARHDRYRTLVPASAPENMTNSDSRKAYVQDLYIQAARMAPGQDWDPDVQVALGVLFNISTEYDKAVDCFKAALSKRPDDYILWNRLGATQAHVGNNREATAAYFRALELHPSFIRARYNLSLASTNMGQHREAAENCLIALSLQQRDQQANGPQATGMSATIWNALQLSMYMMGEPKLAEACEKQNLDAFREKFEF